MIDEIDKELKAWVLSILDNVDVHLGPPGDGTQGNLISLYLMELHHEPPSAHHNRSQFFQLSLQYLVTAWADQPEIAHRMLGELAFRASEHADYHLSLEALSAETWAAFGVVPRPSVLLRVPLRHARDVPPAQIIRHPTIVRESPLSTMEGVVLGPGELPVVGAYVELPGYGRAAYTDTQGRFVFPSVPAVPERKQLRIRAKGRDLAVYAERRVNQPGPVLIHLDLTEV